MKLVGHLAVLAVSVGREDRLEVVDRNLIRYQDVEGRVLVAKSVGNGVKDEDDVLALQGLNVDLSHARDGATEPQGLERYLYLAFDVDLENTLRQLIPCSIVY